ncbi:hypothetical protein ACHAQA_000122 [Verticillium albo-atrum]
MVNFGSSATLLVSALGIVAAQGRNSCHGPSVPLAYANLTSQLDEVLSRGYLTVGTTGDYKPFTYLVTDVNALPNSTSINTTYIGADIDAAQSLSNALGLPKPPRFVHTTWSNITSDLAVGKFDIAMGGVSLTLTRARTAFFSTAVQRVGKTACIRCSDAAKFTDLDSIDQEGVRVAANPGGTNEAFDRANLDVATIVMFADNNAVFEAVRSGEADVMISDLVEVELQVRLHKGELCIVNPDAPFNFEELAYAIQRDSVWKNFVDAWVHVQLGSGAWNTTLEKWLDYKWPLV